MLLNCVLWKNNNKQSCKLLYVDIYLVIQCHLCRYYSKQERCWNRLSFRCNPFARFHLFRSFPLTTIILIYERAALWVYFMVTCYMAVPLSRDRTLLDMLLDEPGLRYWFPWNHTTPKHVYLSPAPGFVTRSKSTSEYCRVSVPDRVDEASNKDEKVISIIFLSMVAKNGHSMAHTY